MRLTLIRHSKTILEPNVPNPLWQLSDEGIALATELSKKDVIQDIDVMYTSLQTKALQTSLILAKDNHIQIKTNPDLTELTSITIEFFSDYEEKVRQLYAGEVSRINGGETLEEGRKRFNSAIESIVSQEKSVENIGIVAHGNILSLFSAQFSEKDAYELHQLIQMPDVAILDYNLKKYIKFYG